MHYKNVRISSDDGIGRVVLDRPEAANALTSEMAYELTAGLQQLEADNEVRVVVLTSSGANFCAGADLGVLEHVSGPVEIAKMIRPFNRLILAMRGLDKPIIAAVRGHAAGGGVSLALASDMVVASESAQFGFVYPRIGLSCADLATTYLLPRVVGLTRAMEILLTGATVSAQRALEIGIVNMLVPDDDLESSVREFAQKVGACSPASMMITKLAVNRGLSLDLATDLEYETHLQTFCMMTEDFAEGIGAFKEKRPARYRGQ